MTLIEAVPNFSEGRDERVVEGIVAAARSGGAVAGGGVAGGAAWLLDRTSDGDHNRSVLTLAGAPEDVEEAVMRAAATAVERIDLRTHRGGHPRIGALDVAPFVALREIDRETLVERVRAFGERLWRDLGTPVYFYGWAAGEKGRRLEEVRRGGFEALAADGGRTRRPDIGGPAPHPTAGATAVGARPYLIAFNVSLETSDPGPARRIARQVRESSGGYRAVKALGLELPSSGRTQVSMNLTDFQTTSPKTVFERILAEAAAEGVAVVESELIGLIPEAALEGTSGEELRIKGFDPSRMILERRLAALSEQGENFA